MASGEPGTEADSSGEPGRQPGRELAGERERRGIELAAMAAKLHLPERQLEALERDDYQQLPPPAFVRGYLRAYAREVDLDGDEIVAAYDALGPAAEDPALRPVESSGRSSGSKATVASVIVLVGVVAAAFFGWWWQNREDRGADGAEVAQQEAATQGDTTAATEAAAEGGEGPAAAEGGGEAQGSAGAAEAEPSAGDDGDGAADDAASVGDEAQAGADEAVQPSDEAGATGDAAGDEAATAAAEGTRSPQAASGGDALQETGDAAPDGEAAGADGGSDYDPPSATSSAAEAVAPAASEGPDTLELEVAGRSWVEVYDARGRELVYTLYTGDEPLRLRGWAPFDVFLGNSPDVRVRFEGGAVPTSAFTRTNQTARFLVDAEGARPR